VRFGSVTVNLDHDRGYKMEVRFIDEAFFRLPEVFFQHFLNGGLPPEAAEASCPYPVFCEQRRIPLIVTRIKVLAITDDDLADFLLVLQFPYTLIERRHGFRGRPAG